MSLSIGDDWTYVMGVNARVDVHDAIPPVTMKSNEAIIVDDEGCDGWVAERGHCSLMRNAERSGPKQDTGGGGRLSPLY